MADYATSATVETKVVARPFTRNRSVLATDYQSTVLDSEWAKQAFLVKSVDLDPIDVRNRTFSSVELKFTDTTLGGNYAINAKPQFTRYSDIRAQGRKTDRVETSIGANQGKVGMGRYYSEAIDDNSQLIHMRFGVPQYNSLTKFFTGFYNTSAGRLARTGRTNDFFASAGFATGLVAQIIIWPVAAVMAIGHVLRFFFDRQTSKYYYLKPTMFVYWSAVNSMVNKIAVGRGLFPLVLRKEKDQNLGSSYEINKETLSNLHEMMPDVFSSSGGYDIYAAANRAQRLKIANDARLYEAFEDNEEAAAGDFYGKVKTASEEKVYQPRGKPTTIFNALGSWLESGLTKVNNNNGTEADVKSPEKQQDRASFWKYLQAELDDGGAFATMRVDYTGPVQESFSNSVRESDIAGKVNSLSSQARSASFSFQGGNLVGGAVGAVAGGVASAVTSFASGVLDSMNFSGLVGVGTGAFVDIPKHWDSSSASLPKSSYTMQLVSPYGNVVSQMQNIYIPMAMLLAAALPLSTGKQSYTSPFILELYDKGRHQTRLGMIDSLSFTRGTSNLGFNKSSHAMAIDVSFSIVDMSSILHMQIAKGHFEGEGIFDEETVFSDYMNTLSSLGLHEQFHTIPKLRLRAARSLRNLESLTSPARWASFVKNETPIGMLEVFFKGTNK